MEENIDLRRIGRLVLGALALIVGAFVSFSLFEVNHASKILVIQSLTGSLHAYTTSGPKPQMGGTATIYDKRSQFSFSSKKNQGAESVDESIKVQFAEGGTAKVSGVLSWEMPSDEKSILDIHSLYGSQHSVDQQLVRPAIERALYLTGTLMTSSEAYSARKAEFLQAFEDQVRNGIYQTEAIEQKQQDPITGAEKTVKIVRILRDNGIPRRASESALTQFRITILPGSIDNFEWDGVVSKQIQEQQHAITQVQTAIAQAKEAEQKAITVAKQGEAEAAQAKWAQEKLNATLVSDADGKRRAAELNKQAAEFTKQEQILLGQGESERKRLVMSADGALDPKLQTWLKAQEMWASAFANYKGAVVPSVVSGGSGPNGNAAINFMEMLGAKAAKDLSLDLSVKSNK